MDLDKLNFLPEWDDEKYRIDEEGEEWKLAAERTAAKEVYLQWRELFGLVMAFTENLSEDSKEKGFEKHDQIIKDLIYENAMIIAPKIIGAAGCGLYVLQMENAAIIRTNCRQLMEQVGVAVLFDLADKGYKKVIEEAMNEFRERFKTWVGTFQKDEYEDEWGLFN